VLFRSYKLEETGYDGVVKDASNAAEVDEKKSQAIIRSFEWADRIPVGVFFKMDIPTYEEKLAERLSTLKELPMAKQDIYHRDVKPLFEELL